MKEFLEIMEKDILSENFSKKEYVIYGILAPLVLVMVCGLAGGSGVMLMVAMTSQPI